MNPLFLFLSPYTLRNDSHPRCRMLLFLLSIAPIHFSSFSLFVLFYFDVAITRLPRGPYSRFRRIFSIPIVVSQSFNDLSCIFQQRFSLFFFSIFRTCNSYCRCYTWIPGPSGFTMRMTFRESPRKSLWKSLPLIIPDKTPMITSSTIEIRRARSAILRRLIERPDRRRS